MDHTDFRNIGQRLRDLLFAAHEDHPEARPPAGQRAPSAVDDHHDFTEHLRDLVHRRGQAAVGRLQVLGFQAVRDRLGDQWPRVEDKVTQIIESTIRQRLAASDVFRRFEALTYVLVFGELSAAEARVKAHFIAEEIWQQLFGLEETRAAMDVAVVTVDVTTGTVEAQTDIDATLAKLFAETEVDTPAAARLQRRKSGADKSAPSVPPVIIPLRTTRPGKLKTQPVLVPIWPVGANQLDAFQLLLSASTPDGTRLYGHDILGSRPNPLDVYDLDLATLTRTSTYLEQLARLPRRVTIASSAHYTTFVNSDARRAFLDQMARLSTGAADRLIVEIHGFTEGFPAFKAREIVAMLQPHCRAISALLPPSPQAVAQLKDSGIKAFGIFLQNLPQDARQSRMIEAFATEAHKTKARSYIRPVNTLALAAAAVGAGIDMLIGDIVHPPFERLEDALAFRPENLFAGLGREPVPRR